MLLLLPPGVERRTGNTKTVTDTGNAVGSAGARRDRGSHYRDLRRTKGPTCPTRARKTSFSIVSSPIRFIAAASSSLAASPSRSRNDPSIPDSARSRQRSSRYDGTPSSRDRFSADSPRSRRSTTSRLRPTLQRCPGASPPGGTACPMESVDGLRPPSLPTGPTKTAEVSSKVSFMRAIPSRFHWTMWCPKKPGPAHRLLEVLRADGVGTLDPALDSVVLQELARFDAHMRDVWGLADTTRRRRGRVVGEFLLAHFGDQPITMSTISAASVRRFVLGEQGRSAGSIGVIGGAIGCYLRFRSMSGDRVSELAAAIPRAAHWRLASLPEVLTDAEIDKLLRSFNQSFPSRRRAYAMVRCLIDLG